MKRIFACVLIALSGLAMAQPGVPAPGKLLVDQAKSLLPKAASISNADFAALSKEPDPAKIKSQSLSLVLLSIDPVTEARKNPKVKKDFRFLVDGLPSPAKLAEAMAISRKQGYVSMIQPGYITECMCDSGEDKAEGTVVFQKNGLFEGKVRFVALKQKHQWVIAEFQLPNYKLRVFLGKDGVWEKAALKVDP